MPKTTQPNVKKRFHEASRFLQAVHGQAIGQTDLQTSPVGTQRTSPRSFAVTTFSKHSRGDD